MLGGSDQSSSQDQSLPLDSWGVPDLIIFSGIVVVLDNYSSFACSLAETFSLPPHFEILLPGTVQGIGYMVPDRVLSTPKLLVVQLTCTLAMTGVEKQTTSVGS